MTPEEHDKLVVWKITDTIYQELFGKSRNVLIAESQPHWDANLLILHRGDVDEIIRDYMTVEALQALTHAETSVAQTIRRLAKAGQSIAFPIADYVRAYKLGINDKLWEWE